MGALRDGVGYIWRGGMVAVVRIRACTSLQSSAIVGVHFTRRIDLMRSEACVGGTRRPEECVAREPKIVPKMAFQSRA